MSGVVFDRAGCCPGCGLCYGHALSCHQTPCVCPPPSSAPSGPRYIIVLRHTGWPYVLDVVVADLPDAEHIHVARHPDDTITAVPMEQRGLQSDRDRPDAYRLWRDAWVDASTENGGAA